MKSIDEQDHYEVLELPRTADGEEIERAYQAAHATYSGTSLATYSVFDEADTRAIRERIEVAYRVLSNESARMEYDESLGVEKRDDEAPVVRREVAASVASSASVNVPFEDLEDAVAEEGDDFDGARLRRTRMRRGVEIDQISEVTKISPSYLRFIEEESFKDLPAEVYVRGFVTAYARTIGLEPSKVVPDYMERYREARSSKRRSFLLGAK